MTSLSQIKTDSNWGLEAPKLNQNFQNISTDILKLKNSTTRFKGYHTSEEGLKSKYSVPQSGDYAWVGTPYPGKVYDVVNGQWHNTDQDPPAESVDLVNYYTKEEINSITEGQDAKLLELEEKINQDRSSIDVEAIFTEGFGIIASQTSSDYGKGGPSTIFSYSNYIECNTFELINITFPTSPSESVYGLVFYDSDKKPIKGSGYSRIMSNAGTYGVETVDIRIPQDAYFIRTTFFKDIGTYGAFKATLKKTSIEDIQKQVNDINNVIDPLYKEESVSDYVDYDKPVQWNYGYYIVANNSPLTGYEFGKIYANSSTSVTDFLEIERGEEIEVSVFQSNASTDNGCVLYDYSKNPIKGYRFQNAGEKKTIIAKLTDIPSNAAFLRTSIIKGDEAFFVLRIKKKNVSGIVPNIQERLAKLEYKGGNVLNIKDYGAEDGGNVKTIIRDMLNILEANGGGIIYAPKGTYLLEEPVRWKSNINLIGDGQGLTIFKPTSNLSAFVGDEIGNFTFEKFTIDGIDQKKNSTVAYAKGIFQTKLTNVTYKDINIENTSATGLGVDYFISGIIDNVRCNNCGRDADFSQADGAAGCSGIGIGVGAYQRGNESLTISNCHCNNCGQNGIFVETQEQFPHDTPVGTTIIGCTAEGNRTGFGVSGCDSAVFVACIAYDNHHAGFSYDSGTMGLGSTGKRPKFIGCISSGNGKSIPDDYPQYLGQENGFGWYILQNYQGIELISCNAIGNLKSGIEVVNGITGLNIDGGELSENGEHGINLNGNILNFRISPMLIKSNKGDGIRINASLNKGFIKGISITKNNNGINKTESSNVGDAIINENFVYGNTVTDNNSVD